LWLISDVTDITEGRHFAFVGMVLGILLACLGWRVFKILSFPFLYLLLLVPTGTVALPLLQKIATLISSSIIEAVGIPVYTDGFFIEVPSGRYHVEPGCAGLNLILASAALAPLYAYLLYHSFWKRLVVVGIALILAIFTNGVRIAGIIAITHWGGPRVSIVDDHLLFGWGLFAAMLFLAGYVGSYFADSAPNAPPETKDLPLRADVSSNQWPTIIAGLLSLLIVTSVFVRAEGMRSSSAALPSYSSPMRVAIPDWQEVIRSDWSPAFASADLQIQQSYARNGQTVDLLIAGYSRQRPGHKVIAYDNRIIDQTQWSVLRQSRRKIDVGFRTLPIIELVAASGEQRRYIWLFYWVDGTFTDNPLVAKLLELKVKLLSGDQRAAVVAIATRPTIKGSADVALQSFLREAIRPIEDLLQMPTRSVQMPPLGQP
jgi:EpsI family protein